MNEISRRDFVKLAGGGLAGLATSQLARQIQPSDVQANMGAITTANGTLVLDERIISHIDAQTGRVFESTLWGIPSQYESVLDKMSSPISMGLSELEEWAATGCNGVCDISGNMTVPDPSWPVFETMMNVPVVGLPSMTDLNGELITSIVDGMQIDLSLDSLYDPRFERVYQTHLPLVRSDISLPGSTISTIEQPDVLTGTGLLSPTGAPPSITLYGWKLQFRGPETHPLGSCVTQPVKHFHVEVFRQGSNQRWSYLLNVHLGAYRSGGQRCFVLFNNTNPRVCWKICSPTRDQLTQFFKWVLIAAAVVAGVVLAAWLVSAIASAAATVIYAPLLLLA